jgi:manganese transport protein
MRRAAAAAPTAAEQVVKQLAKTSVAAAGDTTSRAWRQVSENPPLADVFRTVRLRPSTTGWGRLAAFIGPGYLVATGYMDPGNWATALAGGSKFGYTLLFVCVLSSLMAILLQILCVRLGIATGRDLAQSCRDAFPKPVAWGLWVLAELAICATDLAEVIGTAIGINLLFGVPLELGVIITALDVFLILWLQRLGFRWIEAFVMVMLAVIAVCFGIQIAMAKPVWGDLIRGLAPTATVLRNPDMLFIALGIIGATVMPHNLYLHSAIVQTRAYGESAEDKREAIKLASLDVIFALLFALLVNASILVLAAATFHATGKTDVAELGDAHALLSPLLGGTLAPSLFAVALLACGLNSTVTATLSGQAVMEGFINIRLQPWLRRLFTRAVAIVPAAIVTIAYGSAGTAKLLVLSQVVLSFQLPFAIVPLILFTASRAKMGEHVAPRWLVIAASVIAAVIIALNLKLIVDVVRG